MIHRQTGFGEVRHRHHEYMSWFVHDIQTSWRLDGKPAADRWRFSPGSTLASRIPWIGENGPNRRGERSEDANPDGSRGKHTAFLDIKNQMTPDGQTLTAREKGFGSDGQARQAVEAVLLYEKL